MIPQIYPLLYWSNLESAFHRSTCTSIVFAWWTDEWIEEDMVYIHSGILLGHKEGIKYVAWRKVDETEIAILST